MPKYLRKPDFNDIQKLYTAYNNIHGFSRMLGSIDCMHWEWRNCPKACQGQFGRGDKKYPTILLEAVASYDLWIWHAFFGVAGANNDLTVLNNSPLFDDLLDGIDPVTPLIAQLGSTGALNNIGNMGQLANTNKDSTIQQLMAYHTGLQGPLRLGYGLLNPPGFPQQPNSGPLAIPHATTQI
ncbi:ALP1-like protein [Tanacetum coccineum]